MGSARPKQYLELGGLPVLSRTLMVFDAHPEIDCIFLVVSPAEVDFCRETVLSNRGWNKEILLVPGGKERQDSVYKGLKAAFEKMGGAGIVLVHDGVRPFVSHEIITACIRGAVESGACIPGVPATDTIKQADSEGFVLGTVSRENIWLAQTPQAFSMELILAGFEHAMASNAVLTDDAAIMEMYGRPVRIVPGSRNNIKITTPEDLLFAAALLEHAGK